MRDTDLMQFGKHKGKMMGKVPADYLLWLYESMKDKRSPYSLSIKEYIADNAERLMQEIEVNKPCAKPYG